MQLDELPCVLLLASHVWGIWVMSYAKDPKDVAYRTGGFGLGLGLRVGSGLG